VRDQRLLSARKGHRFLFGTHAFFPEPAEVVTAMISPAMTNTSPMVSMGAGTCPKTGQAINAAKPGAKAGNTAARDGPSKDTILE
jgi:hypothetical protein